MPTGSRRATSSLPAFDRTRISTLSGPLTITSSKGISIKAVISCDTSLSGCSRYTIKSTIG